MKRIIPLAIFNGAFYGSVALAVSQSYILAFGAATVAFFKSLRHKH